MNRKSICQDRRHISGTLRRLTTVPLAALCFLALTSNSVIADEVSNRTEISTPVQQQKITVNGVVSDATGPLPGASVLVKGTTKGTFTDVDGKFQLDNVASSATIIISFIGCTTQEVAAKEVVSVTLDADAIGLDEVVAIGYGYQKKKDLTGSVVSVSRDDLTLGGTVSNAAQALQGRTAGVQVSQTSKAPGGSISVRVRGSNSISSSNEPLYVVDGFPSSEGLQLNPNDIESMQILKDASATAIYGARGANGVVIITTKRGKNGENSISYSGYVGSQSLINPFEMLDGQDYMQLQNDLFREISGQENSQYGVYSESQLASTVNTDWVDVTTRTGVVQDHNLQFVGGSENTKVMTSLGLFDQEGILKNTTFTRFSGRVNVDQTVNEYIKAGASVFGQREESNFQLYSGNILNSNVLYSVLTYDPTVKPFNDDGTYGRPPGGQGDNPLANLLERTNDLRNDKFNGNVFLELSPVKTVKARLNGGIEMINSFKGSYLPKSTYQGGIDDGVASTTDYASTRQLLEGIINYNETIAEKHSIGLMLGYTYEKFVSESRSISVKGFSTDIYSYNNLDAASTISSVSSGKSENKLISFLGRANYTYNEKYLFTGTVRRDGSSRFGENQRWGVFPSGSFAWRMSEEEFIKSMDIFSSLKLRAGYGVTGNEKVGNYASYALVTNTSKSLNGIDNSSGTHMSNSSPLNENLKWETTSQTNIGLDMGFFDSKLSVSLDWYKKTTNDLLLSTSLPYYTGFTSGQRNIGEIMNSGIELDITSINRVGNVDWTIKFNTAYNQNEVVDLGGESEIYIQSSKPYGSVSEEDYAVVREGEALGSLFGYVYEGVIQEGEIPDTQPNSKAGDPLFRDIAGNTDGTPDGKITSADRTILGTANPDLIFGLTNEFKYKNFDLAIFFQGVLGNDLFNMTKINLEWNRTTEALNRWTPENTDTDTPRNGFYYSDYGGFTNSHFIEDASYLRFKSMTVGYTLPSNTIKMIKSFRVYAQGENLFTATNYSGWDPEVDTKAYDSSENGSSLQSANAGAGLDFNSYPSMRSYTVGVNITF